MQEDTSSAALLECPERANKRARFEVANLNAWICEVNAETRAWWGVVAKLQSRLEFVQMHADANRDARIPVWSEWLAKLKACLASSWR